jgi:prevent-host-death family protein
MIGKQPDRQGPNNDSLADSQGKNCLTEHYGYNGYRLPLNDRDTTMKAMTAADAKNSFGSFLDAVQREPVVITKKNRPVGMMLSMQDVEALFGGNEDTVARALEEARVDRQLALSRQQVAAGKVTVADAAFFEGIRERIRAKYITK